MRKLLCISALTFFGALQSFAAIAPTSVWEIRTAGADISGGCYDPALSGTDYSQQPAAQVTFSSGNSNLLSSVSSSTTLTSAGTPFTSAMVGNCIQITGGTNFIVGFYEVMSFTDSSDVVLDRAPATAGAGASGTGALGGALATVGKAAPNVVAGNTIWVRADATYSVGGNITFTISGSSGNPITWLGYTTTRGDNGQATLQATVGSINIFNGTATFQRFRNFILDCNTKATCRGWNESGAQMIAVNIKALNFTLSGFNTAAQQTFHNAWATSGATGCTAGFVMSTSGGTTIDSSAATANPCPGFVDGSTSATPNVYVHTISANNTGATSDGWQKTAAGSDIFYGDVAYGNGRDGWRFTTSTSADSITLRDSIAVLNAGYGIDSTTTDWSASAYNLDLNYNGSFGNTTANLFQVHAGLNDPTITGDPFVNGTAGNFALNTTSGAGAALRAVGFPGTMQFGGTGYLDIGALQHQDSGTGGVKSCPIAQ